MKRPTRVQSVPPDLWKRCEALALPFACYSEGGMRRSVSATNPAITRWIRAPYLARILKAQVEAWEADNAVGPVEVLPGCWALPLHETDRRRSVTWTVVIMLMSHAIGAEEFLAVCQSGQLDAEHAASAWRDVTALTEADVLTLWQVLQWQLEDLRRIHRIEESLAKYGDEMTAAYEELAFLHYIGSSLTEIQHPHNFVERVSSEIFKTLCFRWVATGFIDDERTARMMANRLFVSGRLPCSEIDFRREAARILEEMSELGEEECQRSPVYSFGPLATRIIGYPIVRNGAIVGGIFAGGKEGVDQEISSIDTTMIQTAASFVTIMVENASLYDDQQLMFLGTLEALSASIDAKDPYTCGHSERVAYLSAEIARAYGLSDREAERIRIAGLIHDVGKIGVPEAVLCKAGRLTDEEYDQIKLHPEIGFQIVKDIPLLDDTLPGILHHHERYDGRGYPAGLSADHIPLMARIIGLADAFDAMSSTRTYRAAMDREKVLSEIHNGAGTQFDPQLVAVFTTVDLAVFDQMVERHQKQSARGGIRLRLSGEAA